MEIGGEQVDISKDNFDFHIVLPRSLSDASMQGAKRFAKTANFTTFDLSTVGGRKYPFYVNVVQQNGRVAFYDYPTTLNASHEAVQLALAGPYLGTGKHHEILDAREIANFERTIRILLQRPNAAEFRDNIKIIRAP